MSFIYIVYEFVEGTCHYRSPSGADSMEVRMDSRRVRSSSSAGGGGTELFGSVVAEDGDAGGAELNFES